jgi:hypothetical protein
VPRLYVELSPVKRLAIECLVNRAKFSLKANTIVRNLVDEYAYKELNNFEVE